MSVIPASSTRVSSMMLSTFSLANIDNTQAQLLKVESELSSGKAVNVPSDDPAAAATIIQLQQTSNWQSTYNTNIQSATSQLGEADSTLGDLSSLLQQAQQIASQNVGSSATASQRASASAVVQSIYNQILAIGNKQFEGMYLFGGDGGQTAPFAQTADGVSYQVSGNTNSTNVEPTLNTSYQVSGAQVFGSMTGVVSGSTNLAPVLSGSTRLMDLTGATSQGVQPGAITIGNGITSTTVDLSSANTVGDVVNLINAAGVGGITASITGSGLTLSGAGTDNITVTDAGGTEAEELGIATAPSGAGLGNPVTGSALGPKITDLTPISALQNGAGIDNSGLIIGNGTTTKTITWPPTGTVQDILNAINGAGLGVRAEINAAGTGIDVINSTQGSQMSIGENGGNTAAQLGIRSLTGATTLSSLNNGKGVSIAGTGQADFQINLANGSNVQVSLTGAQTVQDVINAINTAGGASVTASLATTGNGIVITDNTAGGSAFSIASLNFSTAAADLGLSGAPTGNTIKGTDVNPIESNGIFANLQSLIISLQNNNTDGINTAAAGLQNDYSRVATINGQVGASEQQLTSVQTQLQLEQTATQSLISQLQDANIAQVSTQYQTLQTSLQASLMVTAKTSQLSLLNYLG